MHVNARRRSAEPRDRPLLRRDGPVILGGNQRLITPAALDQTLSRLLILSVWPDGPTAPGRVHPSVIIDLPVPLTIEQVLAQQPGRANDGATLIEQCARPRRRGRGAMAMAARGGRE